jgi:hypothetical protein
MTDLKRGPFSDAQSLQGKNISFGNVETLGTGF